MPRTRWDDGGPGAPRGGDDPNGGGKAPPKAEDDPTSPTSQDIGNQVSETGKVVPSAYGTVKIAGNIIERYLHKVWTHSTTIVWVSGASYGVGDTVFSNGNIFVCIIGGATGATAPSGTGSNIVDGTVHWAYRSPGYSHQLAIAFCEGQIYGGGQAWIDKTSVADFNNIPHAGNFLALYVGDGTGVNRSTWFPAPSGPNTPYSFTAVLLIEVLNSSDSDIPNIALEVKAIFSDATHVEANPADIAIDLLTHVRRGAAWPSGRVDSVTTGAGAASWRTYSTAFGLILSWLIDSQTNALELIRSLLLATNTDAVWTNRPDGLGGMLKFVPLGDQALTANGVTFTPNTTPVYPLSEADYTDVLRMQQENVNVFNSCPVEYIDRANGYTRRTVDDPDMSDVDLRGLKRAPTTSLPQVLAPASAVMLSRILAQRSLNVRTTYTIPVGWRYFLLEPTDLLTLTDAVIGFVGRPIRITAIEEDQDNDSIVITAEDWPAAVSAAAQYSPQVGDGFKPSLPTNVGGMVVLPGQVPIGTVGNGSLSYDNFGNLWPNPASETYPPDGTVVLNDGSSPEWDYRVNAGAGAFAGSWVREFDNTGGGSDAFFFFGRKVLPSNVGDSFSFSAYIKTIVGNGVELLLDYVGGFAVYHSGFSNAGVWTFLSTDLGGGLSPAPAGATVVSVYFQVKAGSKVQVDNISLVRTPAVDNLYPQYVTGVIGGGVVTYTINRALGEVWRVNGTALPDVIAAPLNPAGSQHMKVRVENRTGGALGGTTWNAVFKMAAWVDPPNTFNVQVEFYYDGTNWLEVSRTGNIPN
jgi:hypothetical protein